MLFPLTLASLVPLASSGTGSVWVVDADGHGDYSSIQAAVNAASDGDTIYVDRPDSTGRYSGFTIDGKSLAVVASPATSWFIGPAWVRNVPADGRVLLHGLGIGRSAPLSAGNLCGSNDPGPGQVTNSFGLTLVDNEGVVHVQACGLGSRYNPGLAIQDCDAVVVSGCSIQSGRLTAGLRIDSSQVVVESSDMTGGQGSYSGSGFSCSGTFEISGEGAAVLGPSSVRFHDSLLVSGLEGFGPGFTCNGPIGSAITVDPAAYVVQRRCTFQFGGMYGFPGGPLIDGMVHASSVISRTLEASWHSAPDGRFEIVVQGEPGDVAYILLSRNPDFRSVSFDGGVLHVGASSLGGRRLLGLIDATGTMRHELRVEPPDVVESDTLWVQAAVVRSSDVFLTGPVAVTQLTATSPVLAASEPAHVDPGPDGTAAGTGRSWASPVPSIRAAAARTWGGAVEPNEIWVLEGTYAVAETFAPSPPPIYLKPMTRLRGGFVGTESAPEERDLAIHRSTLTGDVLGDDGPGFTGRDDNAEMFVHWVPLDSDCASGETLVDGFDFVGAQVKSGTYLFTLETGGSLRMQDCTIRDCDALETGCLRVGEDLHFERFRFLGNRGRPSRNATASIRNSVFAGNVGHRLLYGSHFRPLDVANSLFYANRVATGFGAIYQYGTDGTARVRNCAFWDNSASGTVDEAAQIGVHGGDLTLMDVRSSTLHGWSGAFGGIGNDGADPMLVDPIGPDGIPGTGDEDFGLRAGSPAIDSGDNTAVLAGETDLDGRPRRVDDPNAPDTGIGTAPIVDRGPLERQ